MICQACFNLQMQLYTSFPIEVFNVLVDDLEKMGLSNYFSWWTVQGSSTNDQLLMTLTKLRLNRKDLNLAERFNTCKSTVSNILNTYAAAHVMLFEEVMKTVEIPSDNVLYHVPRYLCFDILLRPKVYSISHP